MDFGVKFEDTPLQTPDIDTKPIGITKPLSFEVEDQVTDSLRAVETSDNTYPVLGIEHPRTIDTPAPYKAGNDEES